MSDEVIPAVVRWVEGHAGARFFLYLHLVDPHTPHRPHPAELARFELTPPLDFPVNGMDLASARLMQNEGVPLDEVIPPVHQAWLSDLYDASVATGDRWVGVFLDTLRDLGLNENTVIAFTADHGEELLDHGQFGHGYSIYSELVDVPLILAGPGIRRGLRVASPVSNRHLAPTLARLGGADLPGMGDGVFLLEDVGVDLPVVFQTSKGRWDGARKQTLDGLRMGAWVLHWRESAGAKAEGVRLFHVPTDPGEQVDVAPGEAERAETLRRLLAARIEAEREYAPAHRVGVGASGLETLIQMGYVDGAEEDEDR
jgi:arylsulfatase A-like enzyme